MDKFKDIWEDRFNTDDHSKDDWLQPSNTVFANISAAVLPAQPSSKRLAWFWWVLIGLASTLFIGLGYVFISSDTPSAEINLTQKSNQTVVTNISNNNNETTKSTLTSISNNNNILDKQAVSAPTDQVENTRKTVNPQNKRNQANTSSISKEEIINTKASRNRSDNEDVIYAHNDKVIIELGNTKSRLIPTETFESGVLPNSIINVQPIESISYQLNSEEQFRQIPSYFTKVDISSSDRKGKGVIALHAQTGLAIQNAQLNEAFKNSLDNADFSSTVGVGYYAGLGLNIPINNKWSLTADINYTQSTSVASHNTNLGYDINRETVDNHTNDYNIGMATPYGLIESNIVIGRSNDLDSDLVSTVADVSSDQIIKAINIAPSLVYNAYNSGLINLELKAGIGLEQILSVNNHVHDVMTNYQGLNYEQGEVVKTQDELAINNSIGQLTTGFNIGYKLSPSSMILLGYEYQKSLNPVFELNDKKTYLNNQNIGLKLRINL